MLGSSGTRIEIQRLHWAGRDPWGCFQGLCRWCCFAQTDNNELLGGHKLDSSVLLIEDRLGQRWKHSCDSCRETTRKETAGNVEPRQERTRARAVPAAAFQTIECQLSLQGMLVWYLPSVFERRLVGFSFFHCCNLPLQDKPSDFSPSMISTRACSGHKIASATSWLKQLVALFAKSSIFFLRKINTTHYLAEKRSLCQAAAHSTGGQPPSRLNHFS